MTISSVSNTYAAQQAYGVQNNNSSVGGLQSGSATVNNTGDSVTISEAAYKALQAATQAAVASATSSTNSSQASSSAASSASQASSTSSGSSSYDFTNMTPNQLLSTVNGLIKSGKMSLDESSPLVPMMGSSTLIRVPGAVGGPDIPANQPVNFMSILQNGISGALSRGDTANAAFLTTGLNALQKLQGTPVAATAIQPNSTSTAQTTSGATFPPQNAPQSVVDA